MEDAKMIGWILIDVEKFINDVKVANFKFDDEMSLTNRLKTIGASLATLYDSKRNLKSNGRESILADYPKYDGYGVIRVISFNGICDLFKLKKEKYIPKKLETPVEANDGHVPATKNTIESERILLQEVKDIKGIVNNFKEWSVGIQNSSVCLSLIDGKLDNLIEAINTLGRVQAESMEYLKNISDGIQTMNDKYNKPSAYIRK